MADVITGNTQLAPTKQDLIIALVQKELKFKAQLLPWVTDFSVFAVKGAKSVGVPKLSSFTVENRASATAGTIQALSSAKDVIDLNFNAYVSWLIDSSDEMQTSIDAQMEFAKRAAAAHGRYVDEQIITEALAVAGLNVGPGPVTAGKILAARKFIMQNDGDLGQTVLVVDPTTEEVMLGLDEFKRADIYGSAVIPSGVIGKVYGMPVMVHNGLAASNALVIEKTGLGFAFQKAPAMAEQPEIAYGTAAKRVAIDQLFGVNGLQLGEKGLLATQSPLVVKMV